MRYIDIEHAIGSDAIAKDIINTVNYAISTRGSKVKIIYVPHEVLIAACKKVVGSLGLVPFIPTIKGIPCQFSPSNEVRVGCVADDNTNFEQHIDKQKEVIH
jgi:hypothetical protein